MIILYIPKTTNGLFHCSYWFLPATLQQPKIPSCPHTTWHQHLSRWDSITITHLKSPWVQKCGGRNWSFQTTNINNIDTFKIYVNNKNTQRKTRKRPPFSVQMLSCFSRPKATHNIQGTYPPARKPVEVDSEHPPLFTGLLKTSKRWLFGISEPSTAPILWNIQCLICWMWVVNGNLWKFGLVQKTPSKYFKHFQAFPEISL